MKGDSTWQRKKESGVNVLWNGAKKEDHDGADPYSATDLQIGPNECNGLKDQHYFSRDTMADIIDNDFCPGIESELHKDDFTSTDKKYVKAFLDGTPESTIVTVSWGDDVDVKSITADQCKKVMHQILDECDRDGSSDKNGPITNPLNWKAGGDARAGHDSIFGEWSYSITPIPYRQPAYTKQFVTCTLDWVGDDNRGHLEVKGGGWLNSGQGHELKDKLGEHKFDPQDWVFTYGNGGEGNNLWEWDVTLSIAAGDTDGLTVEDVMAQVMGRDKPDWECAVPS